MGMIPLGFDEKYTYINRSFVFFEQPIRLTGVISIEGKVTQPEAEREEKNCTCLNANMLARQFSMILIAIIFQCISHRPSPSIPARFGCGLVFLHFTLSRFPRL
jgi:hypothetical protein